MDTTLSSSIVTSSVDIACPDSTGVRDVTPRKEWSAEEEEGPAYRRAEQVLPKRKRLTVYLPMPLLERLRDTVYWTRGSTLAGLLEAALTESLKQRERQRGSAFPKRLQELKGGRPPLQRPRT